MEYLETEAYIRGGYHHYRKEGGMNLEELKRDSLCP